MLTFDIAIVGAGPAGLSAAIEASRAGASVCIIDEKQAPGGQLFKQIHKFFGSREHFAGMRGFNIGKKLLQEAEKLDVKPLLNTIVYGTIQDNALSVIKNDRIETLKAKKIIFATGAMENLIKFPGWTLPGVMGAGAAQTMVNIHRVLPGKRILMIGSGNVGLIVTYQLIQAGAEVVAIIEGLPKIGGYGVHAAKIRRANIPILTSHTIKEVHGTKKVETAAVASIDEDWKLIPNTERKFKVDVICLAVGLTPNIELPLMAGCKTMFLNALGGWVPLHDKNMETTKSDICVAGDVTGIEEATTAIEEGRLAGIQAAKKLDYLPKEKANESQLKIRKTLSEIRAGPFGEKVKIAKQQLIRRAESRRTLK